MSVRSLPAPGPTLQPRRPFVPANGAGLHTALLCVVYLTMALLFTAAQWTLTGSGVFLTATASALLCGVAATWSRTGPLTMAGFGLLASFSLAVLLVGNTIPEANVEGMVIQGRTLLQARAYSLLDQWGNWFQAILAGRPVSLNTVFLLNMTWLLWWIAYFGVWTSLRYGQSWSATLTACVVASVNTYYAPEPLTAIYIFFLFTALLLLTNAHLTRLQEQWARERVRFSQDMVFDLMRNGLLFSVLVVGVAWAVPGLGSLPRLSLLLEPASQVWESVTNQVSDWNQGVRRQMRPGDSAFDASLSLGGPRNSSPQPVMRVHTADGRYWRANIYDNYADGTWLSTGTERARLPALRTFPAPDWRLRDQRIQTVTPLRDLGHVVLGAADIRQLSLPVVANYEVWPGETFPLSEGTITEAGPEAEPDRWELQHLRSTTRLEPGMEYQLVSSLPDVTQWDLSQANARAPARLDERYLQLPEDIDPRIADTARLVTAGADSRYAQAKAIEAALRRYAYDESIPAPPADADPVSWFLFDIQRGYCDYYATAMVLMLRSLGIHARLAAGYAEGTWDPETESFLVTGKDAHSWVEVFFPGLGWIEFEPTAGESELVRAPGGAPEPAALQSRPESEPARDGPPEDPPVQLPEGGLLDDEAFDPDPAGPVLTTPYDQARPYVPLAAGAAALVLLAVLALRGRRGGEEADPLVDHRLNGMYRNLLRWARSLELPVLPTATPMERTDVLARHIPAAAAGIRQIGKAYTRLRFARLRPGGFSTPDESAAERSWREIQVPLRAAWLRRQAHRAASALTGRAKRAVERN